MKIITTILLTFIILLLFLYGTLYLFFNLTSRTNSINTNLRPIVIKYPLLRTLLRLHQIGDYRYDIGNNNYKDLEITVYQNRSNKLNSNTLNAISNQLYNILKQPKNVTFVEKELPSDIPVEIDDSQMKSVLKKYPLTNIDKARIQIFVLDKYTQIPTYAGLVRNANSVFLFMEPIKDVSRFQSSSMAAEVGAILHEIGHLLGAEHIDAFDCIMTDKVENYNYGRPTSIRDKYCPEDIIEIQNSFRF